MALGILGAIGGLAGGIEQGLRARQDMQYRQALTALAQERIKAAQFEQQQRLAQQQAQGLGYEAMLGHRGSESLFKPLPTIGAPQAVPAQPPSPSPPATTSPSLSAGTTPMPTPAPGAAPYHAAPDVGGMAVGGAGGNWELAHNNFAGLRVPGVHAGPHAGGFQSFPNPADGIDAISHQLDRYASGATTGHPETTLRQIVSTWSPPSDHNPTDLLIRRASLATGFRPDQPLNLANPVTKAKVVHALILNEQGGRSPVTAAQVFQALQQAPARHAMHLGQALGGAPTARQATSLSSQIVNTIPPAAVMQMNPMGLMKTIAQRIESAAPPGTPDNVKAIAWMQAMTMYSKFAGPQMKMAFDMWKANADFALKEEQIRALGGDRRAKLEMLGARIQSSNALRLATLNSMNNYRTGMFEARREQLAMEMERLQRLPRTRPPLARSYQVKTPDGKVNNVFGTLRPDPATPGKFTLLDTTGKPIPGEVIGSGAGGKGWGSSYATMITSRQIVAVEQAVRDLAGVSKLPIGTSTGWMGIGAHRGTNIFDTSLDALKRDMTSNEVQLYNNRLVGINRAMAILSSGGVHITDYLTKSYEGLDIKPGDSYLSALDKLATLREDVDFAVDAMTAQPQTSQEQATIAKKFKGMVDEAIPWTTDDTIKLMSSDNPQMTLRQLGVRQTGETGAGKQFGAGVGAGGSKAASVSAPQHYPQPSAQAIAALKAKPGTAAQFDQVFGPGAAKRALGQ